MLVFCLVLTVIVDCLFPLSTVVFSLPSGLGLFLSFFDFFGDLAFFSFAGDLDFGSLLPLLGAWLFDLSLPFFFFYAFRSSFSFWILCCSSSFCFFAEAARSLLSASFVRLSYLSCIFCMYSDLLSSEMPPFSL